MEILRTEHLTKIYGKGNTSVTAVNDLSLSVAQGEFVAANGGESLDTGRRHLHAEHGKTGNFPAQADRSDLSVFQPDPDIKCGGKHYIAV